MTVNPLDNCSTTNDRAEVDEFQDGTYAESIKQLVVTLPTNAILENAM